MSTFIPTLNETATTNEAKADEFQKTFFPPLPPADLSDIDPILTPSFEEVLCNLQITRQQVVRAISKVSPDKAPRPDEITNRVIKENVNILVGHIQALAQASLDIRYFPAAFKQTITAVLRKPCKPDYTSAKAYRPIALENTLGKVLESVMAELISYLTETHNLLPSQHYGGRPGRTAEDAMTVLSENIYSAWKRGEIFTAIFLDIAGAFNNVHHERLIYNLRQRGIPEKIATWIQSFLNG